MLIDSPDVGQGADIPFDDMHLHYGKGQIEADIPLTPVSPDTTGVVGQGLKAALCGSWGM